MVFRFRNHEHRSDRVSPTRKSRFSKKRYGPANQLTIGATHLQIEQLEERAMLSASPLGASFDGIDSLTDALNHDPSFINTPADPHGAAGPTHVVSVVNTSIQWHTKEGVLEGSARLGLDDTGVSGSFFETLAPEEGVFDPKVIYDQYNDRFVVLTLEASRSITPTSLTSVGTTATGTFTDHGYQIGDMISVVGADQADYNGEFAITSVTANTFDYEMSLSPGVNATGTLLVQKHYSKILIAVSSTSNPNDPWHYQSIDALTVVTGTTSWADFPGIAIDDEAIYITNNIFSVAGDVGMGSRLWIVAKGDGGGGLYDGGSSSVTKHDPFGETSLGYFATTQPAHVFGVPSSGALGTFLVSTAPQSGTNEILNIIRVDNPLTTATFTAQSINLGNIHDTASTSTDSSVPNASQLGSAIVFDTNDSRMLQAVWRNDTLWAVNTVKPLVGVDAGQATAHWYQVDTTSLGALTLSDQGNVGGEDIAVGTSTFYPSISVNTNDEIAIGFSASEATIYAGAYYTGRQPGDPASTVGPSRTLRAGEDYYELDVDGGVVRWGDYSGISVDPSDDQSFWVYNQYAQQRGDIPPDGWATQWGKFGFNNSVTGRVFEDDTGLVDVNPVDGIPDAPDGIQHPDEEGRVGETVSLWTAGNLLVATTTTDVNGQYGFFDIASGSYYIEFTEPPAANFTDKDQGGDDALDSDADTSTGQTDVFVLTTNDEFDFDAGIINQFSPDGIIYMLRQFGASLQGFLTDAVGADFTALGGEVVDVLTGTSGIPFIEETISDIVDFTNLFNRIANRLLDPAELVAPNVPSAFFLASDAKLMVSVDGADAVEVILLTGDTVGNITLTDLVDDINGALLNAGIDDIVQAGNEDGFITFTGIGDDPATSIKVSSLRMTATSPAPAFGQLAGDVSFQLTIDVDDGTISPPPAEVFTVDLSATPANDIDGNPIPSTQENVDINDLVDDVNAALIKAGITNVVALTDGTELVLAADDPEVVGLTIANATDLGFGAAQTEDSIPGATTLGFATGARGASTYKFNSVESLGDVLTDELVDFVGGTFDLDYEYDDINNTIFFNLDLEEEFSKTVELDFDAGLDLGALLGQLEVSAFAEVTFAAGIELDLRVGINLDGLGSSFTLTPATLLNDLNDGDGVKLAVGLTAAGGGPTGTLGADAMFDVVLDGGLPVTVTVTAASTSDNVMINSLVEDVNAALVTAGIDDKVSASANGSDQLTFTVIDATVKSLLITGGAALGLGGAQAGDRADLAITIGAGPDILVNLDGSLDVQDVIDAIQLATASAISVNVNADGGLTLTHATTSFTVAAFNPTDGDLSWAGISLGILGTSVNDAGSEVLTGSPLHGQSFLDRFFILEDDNGDAAMLSINASIESGDVDLIAALSFLEIGVVDGTFNLDLTTGVNFLDPAPAASPGDDGLIHISEIFEADSLNDLISLKPLTITGMANLPLDTSLFTLIAPSVVVTGTPAIEASFSLTTGSDGFEANIAPNVDLQNLFSDVISQFKDFSLEDLITALSNLVDMLADSNLPILNQEIPLINKSVNDVIQFADKIFDAINDLGSNIDTVAIEAVRAQVESAIANLSLAPELKTRLQSTVDQLQAAVADTSNRQAARLVSAMAQLRNLIDPDDLGSGDVPALTVGKDLLVTAFNDLVAKIPSVQTISEKVEKAINEALGLETGDPFSLTFKFVDYDGNTSQFDPAAVLGLSFETELFATYDPDLLAGSFGPLGFEGSLDVDVFAKPSIDVGLGITFFGGTVTPFLLVNPPTAGPFFDADLLKTELSVEVGFAADAGAQLQFGSIELVDATGTLNLTAALQEQFTLSSQTLMTLAENVVNENWVVVAIDTGGGFSVVSPDDYTVTGNTVTFNSSQTGDVEVEYLGQATHGDPPYDPLNVPAERGSLVIDFDQSYSPGDGNTIGAAKFGDLFTPAGPDLQADVNALITAGLDATVIGNTIDDAVTVVASLNHFDPHIQVNEDGLTNLFTNLDFDLKTIISGIGTFLDLLEAGLTSDILSKLPVIGDGLDATGTFIGKLRDVLITPLEDLICQFGGSLEELEAAIENYLNVQIGAFTTALTVNVELELDKLEIILELSGDDMITADFDIGLDGLPIGFDAKGGVEVAWSYDAKLGFGVSKNEGFYFVVDNANPEVELMLDVGLAVDTSGVTPIPTEAVIDLFGLKLRASDNLVGDEGQTGFNGMLTLEIDDFNADNKLTIPEISSHSFGEIIQAELTASVMIDLELAAEINANIPSIEADLVASWGFTLNNSGLNFDAPTLALNDIRLNLGDFITKIIGPIIKEVDEKIGPIKPVIDFLLAEVPGISQVSEAVGKGKVLMIDLALSEYPEQARVAKKFLSVVQGILAITAELASFDEGDNISINFGSVSIGNSAAQGGVDLRNAGELENMPESNLMTAATTSGAVTDGNDVDDQVNGSGETGLIAALRNISKPPNEDGTGGLGLKLNLIQEPINILKMILGQTATIVTWDIPVFDLSFGFEASFRPIPVIPPFQLTIGADFGLFADLSVGLDTRGLQTGNFLDGFFFGDLENVDSGEDIPEFGISIGARLRAALDIVIASVGIEGELVATITANWRDSDDNGKLYLDEIADIVRTDGIECLFDLRGELRVKVRLVWSILFSDGSKEFIDALLFSFQNECPKHELGTVTVGGETLSDGSIAAAGTLIVHAGPNAADRGGSASDTAESFVIEQVSPGVVKVDGVGLTRSYGGVTSVYFDGGAHDDTFELINPFSGTDPLNTVLIGGLGNDTLLGGANVDDIRGGAGNDTIRAFEGNDIITGGDGIDDIEGGDGNDMIDGDAGDDLILGGIGEDIIDGGAGSDRLFGGDNNDTIVGGSGSDIIEGNDGNDTIEGNAGGDDIKGGQGNDIISGGSGNDTILGESGNDTIDGNSGHDYIEGNTGVDTINGGHGSDAIIGGEESDILLGDWGNDVILSHLIGDIGSFPTPDTHYIEAGPDDDFVCGAHGVDTIFGGTSTMSYNDVINNPAGAPSIGGFSVASCEDIPTFESVPAVTIHGQKFNDENEDGIHDATEIGLNGWTIELYDDQGDLVATQVTADMDLDSNGSIDPKTEKGLYWFVDLDPGDYTVKEAGDPAWTQSTQGGVTLIDLTLDPVDDNLAYATDGSTLYKYTIDTGTAAVIGSHGPIGQLNSLEFASDGKLYAMGYASPILYELNLATGAASGVFDTGFTSAGGLAQLEDDVLLFTTGDHLIHVDLISNVALEVGQHGVNGLFSLGVTINGDLLAAREGGDIYLIDPTTGEAFSESVSSLGENLEYGTLPFDTRFVAPPASPSSEYLVSLISGQTIENLDFGNYYNPGELHGQKFEDLNGNGIHDTGEPGLNGWTIELFNDTGELVESQTTMEMDLNHDGNIDPFTEQGLYWFTDLAAGDYSISEVQQEGWTQSVPAPINTLFVIVLNGESVENLDFGNYRNVEIHGQKFEDLNGNGRQDPGEPGITGWTIELYDENGNLVETQTTMDMDLNDDGVIDPETEAGLYWFTDLIPGRYTVREQQRNGWTQTSTGGIARVPNLYAVSDGSDNNSSNLYRIADYNTSAVAVDIGETGVILTDLAIHPTAGAFGISYDKLYSIDLSTGEATEIGPLNVGPQNALEFRPDGTLFSLGFGTIYQINLLTGAATPFLSTSIFSAGDLTFDSAGTMYVASGFDIMRINLAGTVFYQGTHEVRGMYGLESTGLGTKLIGGGKNSRLYTVDIYTGQTERLSFPEGGRRLGLYGLSFDDVGFEPSSLFPFYDVTLTSGQVIEDLEFGNQRPPGDGEIHGTKWLDENGNGIRDTNAVGEFTEPGIAGVTIYLDLNNNGVHDTDSANFEPSTTTMPDDSSTPDVDEAGMYWLTHVPRGRFFVREVIPEGFVQSFPSDLIPGNQFETHVVDIVQPGQVVEDVDFGNKPAVNEVHGLKWEDLNGNGVRDSDGGLLERGIPDVRIYADLNNNDMWDTNEPFTFTMPDDPATSNVDETGMYWLSGLPLGTILIREETPDGFTQTFPSDLISGNPFEAHVVDIVQPGHVVENINFGNKPPDSEVHGLKWEDLNGNGVRDSDAVGLLEPGIPDVRIYADLNNNDMWESTEPFTFTMPDDLATPNVDETGMYWLSGVPLGTVLIREETPIGFTQTFPANLIVGGVFEAHLVSINQPGTVIPGVDFGNHRDQINPEVPVVVDVAVGQLGAGFVAIPVGSGSAQLGPIPIPYPIVGFVRLAFDQQVQIQLTDLHLFSTPDDGSGVQEIFFTSMSSPQPNALGQWEVTWQLESPLVGQFVQLILSDNVTSLASFPLDGEWDNPTDINDPSSDTFPSGDGTTGGFFVFDFNTSFPPFAPPAEGAVLFPSLSGQKFNDLNGNGIKDAGEPGLANWRIYLDANGNGVWDQLPTAETSVLTDAIGDYTFFNLAPGTYIVGEVMQPSWIQTAPASGTYNVSLETNDEITGLDFGNTQEQGEPLTSLSGMKWEDLDGDGKKGPNEPGLANWRIYLDLNNNSLWDQGANAEPSTLTDINGNYSFVDLTPGTYIVREVLQVGWVQTFPLSGFHTIVVNPPPTEPNTGRDFGNQRGEDETIVDGDDEIYGNDQNDTIHGDNDPGLPAVIIVEGFDFISGGAGEDDLFGQGRDDEIRGDEDADAIDGGSEIDKVIQEVNAHQTLTNNLLTGQGPDTLVSIEEAHLTGGASANILDATAFNPLDAGVVTLEGLDNNDTLLGSPNQDILIGGFGNDNMSGNDGDDLYLFDSTPSAEVDTVIELAGALSGVDTLSFEPLNQFNTVVVNLTLDTNTAVHTNRQINTGAAGQAANFENVIGTEGDDTITGNAAANLLEGRDGNDTISGLAGNDQLAGGRGNDDLIGGLDNDRYLFDHTTTAEADTVDEQTGGGTDTLDFRDLPWSVNLIADLNNDNIATHTNRSVITASAGLAAFFENVVGGAGDDLFHLNDADNVIAGLKGDDRYVFFPASVAQTDTVRETLNQGIDSLDFSALLAADGVTIDLTSNAAIASHTNRLVKSDLLGAAATNFEHAIGGAGNDDISGNASDNQLTGNDGNDILFGRDGDDLYLFEPTLFGQTDTVRELPNEGTDTLSFASHGSSEPINVDLTSDPLLALDATRTIKTFAATQHENFENVITGDGDDTITANEANNVLQGGEGDDVYFFKASTSNNTVILIDTGGNNDSLNFSALTVVDPVTVDLTSDTTLAFHTNRTIKTGGAGQAIQFENVFGGAGNDLITGNDRDNELFGQGGNDEIHAGKGVDLLNGGTGDNSLFGDAGDDSYHFNDSVVASIETLHEDHGLVSGGGAANGGTDTIVLTNVTASVNFDLSTQSAVRYVFMTVDLQKAAGGDGSENFENIVGSSNAVNTLTGNDADNRLQGGPLNDVISGGDGDDELVGLQGNDTLNGQNNNDKLIGGDDDDLLLGGSGADELLGNVGDDTLDGQGGNDTIDGGTDDDTIIFDATDSSPVAGNDDIDILEITGATTLDLDDIPNFTTIERIDLTDAGVQDLTVNPGDVTEFSGATSLIIDGGAEDSVLLLGGWTMTGTIFSFDIYTLLGETVLVKNVIFVSAPAPPPAAAAAEALVVTLPKADVDAALTEIIIQEEDTDQQPSAIIVRPASQRINRAAHDDALVGYPEDQPRVIKKRYQRARRSRMTREIAIPEAL